MLMPMLKHRRPALVLGALSLAAAGAVSVAPATSAAPGTDVMVGCTEHAKQPTHISLSCADDAIAFDGLTWSAWSSGKAIGRGTFTYNTCLPTCVAGNTLVVKDVTVTLSKPKVGKGARTFSLLRADFPKQSGPAGASSSTFILNTAAK